MYALRLPSELVSRLYRLREEHGLGPIRRQVLSAVESYLDTAEHARGIAADSPATTSPNAAER